MDITVEQLIKSLSKLKPTQAIRFCSYEMIGDYKIKGIEECQDDDGFPYYCITDELEYITCPACKGNITNKYMCETCLGEGKVINI